MLAARLTRAVGSGVSRHGAAVGYALSRLFGLPLLLVPLLATVVEPTATVRTDYLANLYVAGRLFAEGRWAELYPPAGASSFLDAPLNTFAHRLLPELPAGDVAIFMYSPLVAALLSPYSLLTPMFSLLAWQLTSLAALLASAWLLGRATGRHGADQLWTIVLYLPIFQTLLVGHLGIALGLLPLAAGYCLAARGFPFLGGLTWSLLFLKPQFLPAVLLVTVAFALSNRPRYLGGLLAGFGGLAALSLLWLPTEVSVDWLRAFRFADAIFSDPAYRYPSYLVTSLPAIALHWFPHELRGVIKWPGYALAVLIGLHSLSVSRKILSTPPRTEAFHLASVLMLGICVLPLVVPHLLSYDLVVFAMAAMLMRGIDWPAPAGSELSLVHGLYLIVIDTFLVLVMLQNTALARPTVLVCILAALYAVVLSILRKAAWRAAFEQ